MSTSDPKPTARRSPSSDEFHRALAEYLERIECEGSRALDEFRVRHPDFASRLGHQLEWLVGHMGRSKEGLPDSIGPYRVQQRLGSGGMGEVYLAEQTTPFRRPVAIKVIRIGRDLEPRLLRFAAEIQTLASLNHNGIAKVYEAGNDRGRPYFTMEYVPGVPITDYCAQERLDLGARLRLFVEVCAAAEHAHRQGIIHRDLKPQNILVYGPRTDPVVKVIDFGLAKILRPDPNDPHAHTQTAQLVGTPDYMSPEQVDDSSDRHVDTRADVYSLGVVLYELLTGMLPLSLWEHGGKDVQAMVRAIREQQPSSPSVRVEASPSPDTKSPGAHGALSPRRLSRLLAGDLDSIVMKALAKEVEQRYGSVAQLAEDIERYLRHEPVSSRPASTAYVLRKLLHRHRVGATFASLLTVVVLSSLVLINVYALESIHHLERGNLFGLAHYLQQLRAGEGMPPAARPENLDDLEALQHEYELVLAQRDRMRAFVDAPEAAPAGATDRAGWADGRYADEVLREDVTDTLEVLRLMARPGAELDELRLRIDWARRVRELTVDAHLEAWQRVRSEVLADARFVGPDGQRLELSPQVGLVPLRRNPDSGLQEFTLLLPNGEMPRLGVRGWEAGPRTCPVFVLLPGGRVWIGSQQQDAGGLRYDPARLPFEVELQQVDLAPFFAGCDEFTNGQCNLVLAGEHRDPQQPAVLFEAVHPVVDANKVWMLHVLLAWGMRLPTGHEWEYLARGGTDTPFWPGADATALEDKANLHDKEVQVQGFRGEGTPVPWSDRYPLTAPVGTFPANGFHLHDVHGNAAEVAVRMQHDDGTLVLELRGGSWHQGAGAARLTARTVWDGRPLISIGFRPVISVQR